MAPRGTRARPPTIQIGRAAAETLGSTARSGSRLCRHSTAHWLSTCDDGSLSLPSHRTFSCRVPCPDDSLVSTSTGRRHQSLRPASFQACFLPSRTWPSRPGRPSCCPTQRFTSRSLVYRARRQRQRPRRPAAKQKQGPGKNSFPERRTPAARCRPYGACISSSTRLAETAQ